MITTANLVIDPELCKRLDKAVFGGSASEFVQSKFDAYRTELVNLIATYNPEIAQRESGRGLFRLYSIADMLILEESKHCNEMMHANMQTAHNQLKNYGGQR